MNRSKFRIIIQNWTIPIHFNCVFNQRQKSETNAECAIVDRVDIL